MTEKLHLEVFPANVFAPKHSEFDQTQAKVFVTDRRVIVWVEGSGEPIVDEAITGTVPQATLASLPGELRLDTVTGPVFVTRGQGCGCRSPLRLIDAPAER